MLKDIQLETVSTRSILKKVKALTTLKVKYRSIITLENEESRIRFRQDRLDFRAEMCTGCSVRTDSRCSTLRKFSNVNFQSSIPRSFNPGGEVFGRYEATDEIIIFKSEVSECRAIHHPLIRFQRPPYRVFR